MKYSKEELAATDARAEIGLGDDGPIPDLLRVVEDDFEISVMLMELPPKSIAGAYVRYRGQPFILVNTRDATVRQRFTLAHELGNHQLGHGSTFDKRITWDDPNANESAASRFAAAFLMPRDAIGHWFAARDEPDIDLETLVRISVSFGPSPQAVRYRLENIRRLKDTRHIARLDSELDEKQHLRLRDELGLRDFPDSITLAKKTRTLMPSKMQRQVLSALERELLEPKHAAARLRTTVEDIAILRQSVDIESEEDEALSSL